jgi:hypothetical protein
MKMVGELALGKQGFYLRYMRISKSLINLDITGRN